MSKSIEKKQAHILRREGHSILAISQILKISKSTASLWCRDISLTKKQKELLHEHMVRAGHAGRLLGAESNKRKKHDRIQYHRNNACHEIPEINDRELFYLGLGLYWGEGVKTHQSSTGFINSDPRTVSLMKNWFIRCLHVQEKFFRPRLYINIVYKNKEEELLRFWAHLLKLPPSQFGKTVFIKTSLKKYFDTDDEYRGTLHLIVLQGTELKYRISGLIDRVSSLSE